MAIASDMKRIGIIVPKADDEVLQMMAEALGTSKSALCRDIIHELVEMIETSMEGNEEQPDRAVRQLVHKGMARLGEALGELVER